MTTEQMIAAAHKLAASVPGYHYDPVRLEHIVKEGLFALPINEPIIRRGDQYLVYSGPEVVCYKVTDKGAIETKRTRADDDVVEKLIIQYAVEQSKLSTHMGR